MYQYPLNPVQEVDHLGLASKNSHNPKCQKAIMQPEITGIFKKMGKKLGVDPLFIMSSALQESGWDMAHVNGTNSSSNGKPLNNIFGMTKAGGNNIAYPSLDASAEAWEKNWGPYLSNSPKTIQEYAKDLTCNPKHMYNSNPAYPKELANRYKQLLKVTADCGVDFDH